MLPQLAMLHMTLMLQESLVLQLQQYCHLEGLVTHQSWSLSLGLVTAAGQVRHEGWDAQEKLLVTVEQPQQVTVEQPQQVAVEQMTVEQVTVEQVTVEQVTVEQVTVEQVTDHCQLGRPVLQLE